MPVCAALRLAKFNIDTTQTTSFKGLPTPANAIAVISVVMAANYSSMPLLKSFTESPAALLIYTVILSLLMVTRLPLLSLKFKNLKFKGNEGRFIIIGLVADFVYNLLACSCSAGNTNLYNCLVDFEYKQDLNPLTVKHTITSTRESRTQSESKKLTQRNTEEHRGTQRNTEEHRVKK